MEIGDLEHALEEKEGKLVCIVKHTSNNTIYDLYVGCYQEIGIQKQTSFFEEDKVYLKLDRCISITKTGPRQKVSRWLDGGLEYESVPHELKVCGPKYQEISGGDIHKLIVGAKDVMKYFDQLDQELLTPFKDRVRSVLPQQELPLVWN